ncbi:Short-chain dehydrogenases of various substrate specificities [Streptomyces sp. OspMP-M45]|nr:Short-chain dehydrogenases of various substrate specificities [Streptomyces sp. OspMP-M45]
MTKTAVVTAGTGGIGLETALGLAAAGFAVTVIGRDADRVPGRSSGSTRSNPRTRAGSSPPTWLRSTRSERWPTRSPPSTRRRGNR